ncbi:MAG: N-formylglutamate amidohydrolase [Ignisphaera sp.]|nr:N-formylglutamate amidohydrolase [Ignisphaera sp.]MDW8085586.1 N-formylglutamate amidohydrolase [Ignisphaera sp.]
MDLNIIEGFIEIEGRYPILVTALHGFGSDGYRHVVRALRSCLRACGCVKTLYSYDKLVAPSMYHSAVDVYTWEIAYKVATAEELWCILPTLSKIDRVEGIDAQDYNLNKRYAYSTPFWRRVREVVERGGIRAIVDIHGMKNVRRWADICISSRGYTTASRELVGVIVEYFRERGLSVAVDHPFAGGAFIAEFGRPPSVEALALEIKRNLRFHRSRVPEILRGAMKVMKQYLAQDGRETSK